MQVMKRLSSPVRRAAALLAVALLPAVSLAQTPAKDDVRVDVQESRTGSLLFGVGVNSDAGLTGGVVLNERNFDINELNIDILRKDLLNGGMIDMLRNAHGRLWKSPGGLIDDWMNGRAFRGAGQEFRIEAVPGTQLQRYSATFREAKKSDTASNLLPVGFFSPPLAE
jgi:outer membrane protein insertion porin family